METGVMFDKLLTSSLQLGIVGFKLIDRAPYWPDSTPISKLERYLKGEKSTSDEMAINAVEQCFADQDGQFFS